MLERGKRILIKTIKRIIAFLIISTFMTKVYVDYRAKKKGYRIVRTKIPIGGKAKLRANLYFPEDHDRGKSYPAIVMVHSWTMNRWQCHAYAPFFVRNDYVVITYDCRGWGFSGGHLSCADPDCEIEDLKKVIDWLVEQEHVSVDKDKIGITGVSYGGGHSFLGPIHDERIRAAVPMYGWTDLDRSLRHSKSHKYIWILNLFLSGLWASKGRFNFVLMKWLRSIMSKEDLSEYLEEDFKRRSALSSVNGGKASMLVIGSWNDDLFEPNQLLDYYEAYNGPKRIIMTNAGHAIDGALGPVLAGKFVWNEARKWFDYWLKGEQNGVMDEPPVLLYRPWSRTMKPEKSWYPEDIERQRKYLACDNGSSGTLELSCNGSESDIRLMGRAGVHPWSGPIFFNFPSLGFSVPGPRSKLKERLVFFESEPFEKKHELLGECKFKARVVWNDTGRKRFNGKALDSVQLNAFLYEIPKYGRMKLITHASCSLEPSSGEKQTANMWFVATSHLIESNSKLCLIFSRKDPLYALPIDAGGELKIICDEDSFLELPLRTV